MSPGGPPGPGQLSGPFCLRKRRRVHISRSVGPTSHPPFEAVDLDPRVSVLLKLLHLEQSCPRCRGRLRALPKGRNRLWKPERIPQWVMTRIQSRAPDIKAALREAYHLARLPRSDRLETLERARTKFRSPLLAALLIERARETVHDSAQESEHWAALGARVAYRAHDPHLEALAVAFLANAHRARGELTAAQKLMWRSRHILSLCALDRSLSAEIDCLEASLLKDQRRFEEAIERLERAVDTFQEESQIRALSRALLTLSTLRRRRGETAAALDAVRSAIALLSPAEDPLLFWAAHQNLAAYLLDAGDHEQAAALVRLIRPLFPSTDELALLRLEWLSAQIAAARGEVSSARATFQTVIEAFFDSGAPLLAAFAALDLAELQIATGDQAAGTLLAAYLPPIFRSEHLHGEAAAALLLFHRAVADHSLSLQLVRQARETLESLPGPSSRTFGKSSPRRQP